METYPTLRQATGVARTLSKHSSCTMVVYRVTEEKFVTRIRPTRSTEPSRPSTVMAMWCRRC